MEEGRVRKLKGGNFDLDLCSADKVGWKQDPCPWNVQESTTVHRCAVKNTSICQYFVSLGGAEGIDTVFCSFP